MNARTTPTTSRADVRAGSFRAWSVAARPRSFPVAISPVVVGAALGFARTGAIDPLVAVLVFAAALLMQVATNLQNDVGYTVRGAERCGTRTGLPRATANGWLGVEQVRAGILVVALVATGLGIALAAHRGWPVIAIGAASLAAALAYMGGPRPIAYTPFGEATVFVFFGLVAVMGTEWVFTGSVGAVGALASVALGAVAAAALAVNNHRDAAHDRRVGRRTFAVVFGPRASTALYGTLLLVPFALLPAMAWLGRDPWLLLPALALPSAWRLRRAFADCPPGVAFNEVLFRTFRLELWFAALLSAGAVIGRAAASA